MADRSWGDLLREHCADLNDQNVADAKFLGDDSALTSREKYLIAMLLDAAANKPVGARGYGEKAVQAGASKDQILDALRVLRMFAGRPALATACESLRQFEK
ncbi:MAG TPA: carboxymuconolactone decarboxylase family protein [Spirochaetia bacterium]|nr:carboxymuconolactone decarboxylase family protein [Spirochaetia bacterium]